MFRFRDLDTEITKKPRIIRPTWKLENKGAINEKKKLGKYRTTD